MLIKAGTVPKAEGEQIAQLIIPAFTFNAHTFSLDLLVATRGPRLIRENNAISFKIVAGVRNVGKYYGKSKSPLFANYKWESLESPY